MCLKAYHVSSNTKRVEWFHKHSLLFPLSREPFHWTCLLKEEPGAKLNSNRWLCYNVQKSTPKVKKRQSLRLQGKHSLTFNLLNVNIEDCQREAPPHPQSQTHRHTNGWWVNRPLSNFSYQWCFLAAWSRRHCVSQHTAPTKYTHRHKDNSDQYTVL